LKIQAHSGLLGNAGKIAAKATQLVNNGCCCVILNTVKQAQRVYSELPLVEDEKLLFHARFTASDRRRITDEVLAKFGKDSSNRPSRFVLIATQVVEQSLDVDFDHMITEIAPIDLLLQRSGRMHRHREREHNPILHVLLPKEGVLDFGATGYVYAEKPLLRTLATLASQHEIHLPEDFRILIERCYGSSDWEQSVVDWDLIRKADKDWDEETRLLRDRGRQYALCEPNRRIFRPVNNDPVGDDSDDGNGWRAKTRLGANDRTALLVDENQLPALEQGELRMDEVRSLYQRSIKLPSYLPIHTPDEGFGSGVVGKGKLRGLVLLPVNDHGIWRGVDEKGNHYEVTYSEQLGLTVRRMQ